MECHRLAGVEAWAVRLAGVEVELEVAGMTAVTVLALVEAVCSAGLPRFPYHHHHLEVFRALPGVALA